MYNEQSANLQIVPSIKIIKKHAEQFACFLVLNKKQSHNIYPEFY